VEVARLAGLPPEVTSRAREILAELERQGHGSSRGAHRRTLQEIDPNQLGLFPASPHPVLARISDIDVNRMTPIEALNLLVELVAQVRS
jgi:DNA mismatch repair protein MutS